MQEVSPQTNSEGNLNHLTVDSSSVGALDFAQPGITCFPLTATMLDAALNYAAHGWPIFPVQPQNKKHYPNSNGFKDATTDPKSIRAWWQRNPDSMIGVATGSRSGLLVTYRDPQSKSALGGVAEGGGN